LLICDKGLAAEDLATHFLNQFRDLLESILEYPLLGGIQNSKNVKDGLRQPSWEKYLSPVHGPGGTMRARNEGNEARHFCMRVVIITVPECSNDASLNEEIRLDQRAYPEICEGR